MRWSQAWMLYALVTLIEEKFKNELVAKGFSRAKGFSWDKTAEQFLEILSESTYKIS